ncbi:MAG: polymer-forming cytoskeletal protein [Kiritimatiellia bacterium]|nr:polymer-forming cytoskeletal protein [Kiritimatiellia bacterium]
MEPNDAQSQSLIAADVEITGNIKSASSIRVDGKLDGEIFCDQDAFVGKSAQIKGNVTAASVVVEGAVQGNVIARDRVDLKASARILGDIKAKRLLVEDGVTFVGRSDVNPGGTPAVTPRPETPAHPAPDVASSAQPAPQRIDAQGARGSLFGKR